MRYLRMLTNAVVGGLLGAVYMAVVILQINPHVQTVSVTTLGWLQAMGLFYGLYLSVAIYFALLLRELLALSPLSPAWLSARLLAWVGAACAGAASIVTWRNLESFRDVLGPDAAERMRQGATATTVCALVLAAVALLRYSFGRRGSRATSGVLVLALVASVAAPIWFRGPGEVRVPSPRRSQPLPEPPARVSRVRLLLLDGASLDFVRPRVATGQLPTFKRLLEQGGVADLATLKPAQVEPIWAAAATGKYAPKTGVRSNAVYRVDPQESDPVDLLPDYCFAYALVDQNFVTAERLNRSSLRARPIWEILSDYRIAPGIINWPLSYPAQADYGYVISDLFDEGGSSPLRLGDAQAGDPTTAVDIAREVFDSWQDRPWSEILPSFAANELPPAGIQLIWDRPYSESSRALAREFGPRFTAVRYEGLEVFGHAYLREAQPELFGDSARPSRERSVLDRYYAYVDAEIARAIETLEAGDLLLVVSGFGMEAETLTKRVLSDRVPWLLGGPARAGTHERAPDGFLLAYGTNVAAGEVPRGAIVDLVPTILYYLGLHLGDDMDGRARTDLFERAFTSERQVAYIPTYER